MKAQLTAMPMPGVPGPLQFFTMTQTNFWIAPHVTYLSQSLRNGRLCALLFWRSQLGGAK